MCFWPEYKLLIDRIRNIFFKVQFPVTAVPITCVLVPVEVRGAVPRPREGIRGSQQDGEHAGNPHEVSHFQPVSRNIIRSPHRSLTNYRVRYLFILLFF